MVLAVMLRYITRHAKGLSGLDVVAMHIDYSTAWQMLLATPSNAFWNTRLSAAV